MSNTPKTVDPIENPVLFLQTTRPKKNPKDLESIAKTNAFAGEAGRYEDEHKAALRRQKNLSDFDRFVKPALKEVAKQFPRNAMVRLAFIETEKQSLGTFWEMAWRPYPLGRIFVDEDGNWGWNNDRDEILQAGSAQEAMSNLLDCLKPAIKDAQRRDDISTREEREAALERQAETAAENRRRMREEGWNPAMTEAQSKVNHEAHLKRQAKKEAAAKTGAK